MNICLIMKINNMMKKGSIATAVGLVVGVVVGVVVFKGLELVVLQ